MKGVTVEPAHGRTPGLYVGFVGLFKGSGVYVAF